jgi:HPt (histidine-containing phosphotransfer) domain-containing protein
VLRDGDFLMSDIFAERVAAVRQRFAGKLDARINVIASAVPQPGGGGLDALVLAHREAHGLCGVGATLGFVGTGKAARSIEQLLLAAVKGERTLTDDEIPRLREGIALLRSTATAEMHPAGQE